METESEFGKGFIYNLVLIAKHVGDIKDKVKVYEKIGDKDEAYNMWFYAAGDHAFELEVPEQFIGTEIGEKAEGLKRHMLKWRFRPDELGRAGEEQWYEAVNMIDEIAFALDEYLGAKPIKASWN